jgi:NAD(P)H-quinone oxidoreductase subunit 4L
MKPVLSNQRGTNMWSSSNTFAVIYCAIISILTVLLVTDHTGPLFSWLLPEFHGLGAVTVVLALGAAFYLLGVDLAPLMVTGSLATFVCLTYNQDDLTRYLTLAALLFSIGIYGMTVSRNAVRVLMSIELMLNAVNLNLVAFARYIDPVMVKGQLFAIFILTVAAAEAAVGLAIVLAIYRNASTVDMEKFSLLKW